jgi:hypothetical protein
MKQSNMKSLSQLVVGSLAPHHNIQQSALLKDKRHKDDSEEDCLSGKELLVF